MIIYPNSIVDPLCPLTHLLEAEEEDLEGLVSWVGSSISSCKQHPGTRWCPRSIAFSWFITPITMVYR